MDYVYLKGYGVITPWGQDEQAFTFDTNHNVHKIIPEINPADNNWKGMKRFSRDAQLCCMAIGTALRKSKIDTPFVKGTEESVNTGIIIGTSLSNLSSIAEMQREAEEYGVNNVNPSIFPNTVLNVIGGYASIYFNILGTNITLSNGDLSGPKALLYATDLLKSEQLDRVIVCQCNIFPPDEYRNACEYKHSFESVVAIVLERDKRQLPLTKVIVRNEHENFDQNFSSGIKAENFLMAALINERKLSQYGVPKTQLRCDLGNEGALILTMDKGTNQYV